MLGAVKVTSIDKKLNKTHIYLSTSTKGEGFMDWEKCVDCMNSHASVISVTDCSSNSEGDRRNGEDNHSDDF